MMVYSAAFARVVFLMREESDVSEQVTPILDVENAAQLSLCQKHISFAGYSFMRKDRTCFCAFS
jgi:hypothetical protein